MKWCAFDKGDHCEALLTHNCEKCSFRKTREEVIAGREKAMEILSRLPEEQQAAIRDKYHGKRTFRYDIQL